MSSSWYRLFNTVTFLITLFTNYYVNTPAFGTKSIGEISDSYSTLVTPAGYAFSIWGIIYLLLIGFLIYQWSGKAPKTLVKDLGPWFSISNLANAGWVVVFLQEQFWLSVVFMFLLLICLLVITLRLKIAVFDAGLRTIFFVWWPFTIYLGWICTASVVNVSAALVANQWNGWGLTAETWAVIMLFTATGIYLFLTLARNLREAAAVGVWAFMAIGLAQGFNDSLIGIMALIASGTLAIAIAIHSYRGLHTAPHMKWKRGEW